MASQKDSSEGEATAQGPSGGRAEAPTEKISKKEAVRRSLARLGKDAQPVEIQADVLGRFGIEMTTGHISTTKGELRREAAGKKPAAKQEVAGPQEQPAPPAPAAPATPAGSNGAAVL